MRRFLPNISEGKERVSGVFISGFTDGIFSKIGKNQEFICFYSILKINLDAHQPFLACSIKEEYYKWHSPSLDRDMEMLVFGHAGQPVILFPTSKGAYYQNKDQGMIEAAQLVFGKRQGENLLPGQY